MLTDVRRLTAGRSLPPDEEWVRQVAAESVRRRSPDPRARSRQLAADRAARPPKGGIAEISQPVLALGGDEDPLGWPAAGPKIAETVQDGRFVLVHRMGHLFSRPLWPELVGEIERHAV
ncbi:MAG: alpha/beta fold hydrolase [Streptosporangiaceae bacterium]